ncbi:MAG TPA: alpha/beta hydrolase, partial [Burkholderiales bacterium]|nr:alpha/beta hydrolase [Burkholderiales bacterium]
MDKRLASGTVNASQSGNGPPLVLLHSLLSDRASFDKIVPELSKSFRVVVPELPGFGQSQAVSGGLAAVADRMAGAIDDCADGEDVVVLGNGYGGFVTL